MITNYNIQNEYTDFDDDHNENQSLKKIRIKGRKVKKFTKNLSELDESDEEFFNSYDNFNQKKNHLNHIIPSSKSSSNLSDNSSEKSDDSKTYGLKFHNKLLSTGKILSHWNDNSQKIRIDMKLLEKTNDLIQKITTGGGLLNTSSANNDDKFESKPLERWSSDIETGKENQSNMTAKTTLKIEEKLAKVQKVEANISNFESLKFDDSERSKTILNKTLTDNDATQVFKNFTNITNSWLSGLSSATKIVGEATKTVASTTMSHASKRLVDAQNIILSNAAAVTNVSLPVAKNLTNSVLIQDGVQQPSADDFETNTCIKNDWQDNDDIWDDELIVLAKQIKSNEQKTKNDKIKQPSITKLESEKFKNTIVDDDNGWDDWGDTDWADGNDDKISQIIENYESKTSCDIQPDVLTSNGNDDHHNEENFKQISSDAIMPESINESWDTHDQISSENTFIYDGDDSIRESKNVDDGKRVKRDLVSIYCEKEDDTGENPISHEKSESNDDDFVLQYKKEHDNVLDNDNISYGTHWKYRANPNEDYETDLNSKCDEILETPQYDEIGSMKIDDNQSFNQEIVDGWDDWQDKDVEEPISGEQSMPIGWSIDSNFANVNTEIERNESTDEFDQNENSRMIGFEPIESECNNITAINSNICNLEKIVSTENNDNDDHISPSAPSFEEIFDDNALNSQNKIENDTPKLNNLNEDKCNDDTNLIIEEEVPIQDEKSLVQELQAYVITSDPNELSSLRISNDHQLDNENSCQNDWNNELIGLNDSNNSVDDKIESDNPIIENEQFPIFKTETDLSALTEESSIVHKIVKKCGPVFEDEYSWENRDDEYNNFKSDINVSTDEIDTGSSCMKINQIETADPIVEKEESAISKAESAIFISSELDETISHKIVKNCEPLYVDEQSGCDDWDDEHNEIQANNDESIKCDKNIVFNNVIEQSNVIDKFEPETFVDEKSAHSEKEINGFNVKPIELHENVENNVFIDLSKSNNKKFESKTQNVEHSSWDDVNDQVDVNETIECDEIIVINNVMQQSNVNDKLEPETFVEEKSTPDEKENNILNVEPIEFNENVGKNVFIESSESNSGKFESEPQSVERSGWDDWDDEIEEIQVDVNETIKSDVNIPNHIASTDSMEQNLFNKKLELKTFIDEESDLNDYGDKTNMESENLIASNNPIESNTIDNGEHEQTLEDNLNREKTSKLILEPIIATDDCGEKSGWDDWGNESNEIPADNSNINEPIKSENDSENRIALNLNDQIEQKELKINDNCESVILDDDDQCGWDDWDEKSDSIKVVHDDSIKSFKDTEINLNSPAKSNDSAKQPVCDDHDRSCEKTKAETSAKNLKNNVVSAVLISPETGENVKHKIVKKCDPVFDEGQSGWDDWNEDEKCSHETESKVILKNEESKKGKVESSVLPSPERSETSSFKEDKIMKKHQFKSDKTQTKENDEKNKKPTKKFNIIEAKDDWENDWDNKIEATTSKNLSKTDSKINKFLAKNKPKFNLVDHFDSDSATTKQNKPKAKFSNIVDNDDWYIDQNDDWTKPSKNTERNTKAAVKTPKNVQSSMATAMMSPSSMSSKQYQQLHNQIQANYREDNHKSATQPIVNNQDIRTALKTAAVTTMSHAVKNWSFNPVSIFDTVVDNLSNVIGVPSAEEMATVMKNQNNQQPRKG